MRDESEDDRSLVGLFVSDLSSLILHPSSLSLW